MKTKLIDLDTRNSSVTDVTHEVQAFAAEAGGDGAIHVFAPHATAGIALMETGAGSEEDLAEALGRLLPRDDRWVHRHGSSGHGADHVLPAFVSPSTFVPVIGGKLELGTWQSIVFVDLNRDNPQRKLRLSFIPG